MREVWRNIKGYEDLYQVSNLGRVKSLSRKIFNGKNYYISKEKILKPAKDKDGYVQVLLYKNNRHKTYKVHRLVAMAFLPNPNNLPQINHKDENKQNNYTSNLEWCTPKYNQNYGNRNKKSSESLKGRTLSEETKKKMSKSHIGIHLGSLSPKYDTGYKIQCLETGEINTVRYFSEKIAKEQNKNPKSIMPDIHRCIVGKRKSASGFHWIKIEN